MANNQLPVNDQTRAVLNKYGITAPRKITNIQNIQNKTETDIRIVQPDIKVSQPQININPVELAAERYRNWVSSAYNRQKVLADKQKEDLREKEYSLMKNINKIFRTIEDLSGQLVQSSRNFKRKLDSGMAPLVTMFIATLLPVIWKPLMARIDSIEKGFRYLFFGQVPENGEAEGSFSFIKSIRGFLGMDDSEGKGLLSGIGNLISEGVRKIIEFLDIQREDRLNAIHEAMKADPGFSGNDFDDVVHLKKNFGKTFNFLGGLLTAALGGTRAYARRSNKEQVLNDIEQDSDTGNRKGLYIRHAIKTKSAPASYYISDQAVKYINNPDKVEFNKLQLLFSEIGKLSDKGGAYVSEDFINTFLKTKKDHLIKSGDLKETEVEYGDEYTGYLSQSSNNRSVSGNEGMGGPYAVSTWQMSTAASTMQQPVEKRKASKNKAYLMSPKAFSEIFNLGDNEKLAEDLYSREGTDQVYSTVSRLHREKHQKDGVEYNPKEDKGSKAYHDLQKKFEEKEKRLDWLNDPDNPNYKHINNAWDWETSNDVSTAPTVPTELTPDSTSNLKEGVKFNNDRELGEAVVDQAVQDWGKINYVFGGKGYYNTDCSGYISNLYKKFGVNVPAGSINIYDDAQKGKKAGWIDINRDYKANFRKSDKEPNWDKLQKGDIMVWSRYGQDYANDRKKYRYTGHVSIFGGIDSKTGKPIIIGHGGRNGEKGTYLERNDSASYLGSVRYNLDSNSISNTSSGSNQGDPGDSETTPKVTSTNVEPVSLDYFAHNLGSKVIGPSEYSSASEFYSPLFDLSSNISIKSEDAPETNTTEPNPVNTSNNNLEKHYTSIEKNLQESINNCKQSVKYKTEHAKSAITT